MAALTFRKRLRAYLKARGDVPPTPEWYDGLSRSRKVLGTVVVAVVGAVAVLPFVALYFMAPPLPAWGHVVAVVVLFSASYLAGTFLGGPVADHLLGTPREVPAQ
jgi:hypothetical protein